MAFILFGICNDLIEVKDAKSSLVGVGFSTGGLHSTPYLHCINMGSLESF